MEKGSGTRSGLLWEVERILLELKDMERRPDVLLMENVPQVCGTANIRPWNDWLDSLHRMGYTNYFRILNAKDYAIPQNRERCFMVSILGNHSYSFPKPFELRHSLGDFLDTEPDPRLYLDRFMPKVVARHGEPLPRTIRYLSPWEFGKLMGFTEGDFRKMKSAGLSNVSLYHSAGDSIVVTVLMSLFGELLQTEYRERVEKVADGNSKGGTKAITKHQLWKWDYEKNHFNTTKRIIDPKGIVGCLTTKQDRVKIGITQNEP